MQNIIKTSIKGNENVSVKETQDQIWELLIDKNAFIRVTRVVNDKEKRYILKKTNIKLVKEQ